MRQQHGHCPILRMSVNGGSTLFNFESWVIQGLIGCRHPLMRYWRPLGAKTAATRSLPQPENERQRSVHDFWSCIFGNQGILRIFDDIQEILTALLAKSTIYQRKNTDSQIIDIANCQTCKNHLLAVEYTILISHCYQTAKSRALCKSIDGPAGDPAGDPPNPVGLGDLHQTVPKFMVLVY